MVIAIIIVWIISTILSLPPLFGFGEVKFSFTTSLCTAYLVGRTDIAPNFYVLVLVAEGLIPLIILLVMYIWILIIVRKSVLNQLKKSVNGEAQQHVIAEDSVANKKRNIQLRLVRTFTVIYTANLITWVPMMALVITGAILGAGRVPIFMYSIALLSYLSETVIHPILESVLIREVRLTLYSIVK